MSFPSEAAQRLQAAKANGDISMSEGAEIAFLALRDGARPLEVGQELMNNGVDRATAQRMLELGAARAHVPLD